jgi:hypothetical protein
MIHITFATIVESMFKQIPQIDFTFSIGDIVGSIALLVSAFTFYISYSQASQSEQIRTSRDLWAGIKDRVKKIREKLDNAEWRAENLENANPDDVRDCISEIEYFAYLISKGEIKVTFSAYSLYMDKKYGHEVYTFSLFESHPYIVQLIEEWSIQDLKADVDKWRKRGGGAEGGYKTLLKDVKDNTQQQGEDGNDNE